MGLIHESNNISGNLQDKVVLLAREFIYLTEKINIQRWGVQKLVYYRTDPH